MEERIERRAFLKGSALALGGAAVGDWDGIRAATATQEGISHVFFTSDISPDGLLRIYSKNSYMK